MAWVRIEDAVTEHRKHLKAGPAACWLWVCGIAYCQRQLSDGFIPTEAIGMIGVLKGAQALAKTLVQVGLFDEVEGGYHVHDYHDFNDTRQEALARQHAAREQRRRAGLASGRSRHVQRDANGPVERPLNPIPSHPIPSRKSEPARSDDSPLERVTDAFRAHWKRLYGHESLLTLNHLQVMKLEQQIDKCGEQKFLAAMAAYFATDDSYVRKERHPLGLFLSDPTKYLAKEASVRSSATLSPEETREAQRRLREQAS